MAMFPYCVWFRRERTIFDEKDFHLNQCSPRWNRKQLYYNYLCILLLISPVLLLIYNVHMKVSTDALVKALEQNQIAGAALDGNTYVPLLLLLSTSSFFCCTFLYISSN